MPDEEDMSKRCPKTRILKSIVRGCIHVTFGEFPTNRQILLMARYPELTSWTLGR